MSGTVSIKLSNRSKKQPIKKLPPSIELPGDKTVEDAKVFVARQAGIADFNRIGLFDPATNKTLKDRKELLRDLPHKELLVKDLGPQMAWRTVYIIEYLGPLLFHPLFLALRTTIYPPLYPYIRDYVPAVPAAHLSDARHLSAAQQLSFACVMLHFLKREVENMFVHKFSANTMPAWNIFRNSFFYWAVAGLLAALEIYAPFSFAARADNTSLLALGLALFLAGETLNLMVHLYLSGLRKPGDTKRSIPRGYGFEYVTSPNYLYEIIAWIGVIIISRSPSLVIFIGFGTMYMYPWAKSKERAYRETFGDKYKKKRYVIIPGLL